MCFSSHPYSYRLLQLYLGRDDNNMQNKFVFILESINEKRKKTDFELNTYIVRLNSTQTMNKILIIWMGEKY